MIQNYILARWLAPMFNLRGVDNELLVSSIKEALDNLPDWLYEETNSHSSVDISEITEKIKNKYEKACKEWLKGCSCAKPNKPEECKECTQAFLNHIKNLAKAV